jgi:hypothetical protein
MHRSLTVAGARPITYFGARRGEPDSSSTKAPTWIEKPFDQAELKRPVKERPR